MNVDAVRPDRCETSNANGGGGANGGRPKAKLARTQSAATKLRLARQSSAAAAAALADDAAAVDAPPLTTAQK